MGGAALAVVHNSQSDSPGKLDTDLCLLTHNPWTVVTRILVYSIYDLHLAHISERMSGEVGGLGRQRPMIVVYGKKRQNRNSAATEYISPQLRCATLRLKLSKHIKSKFLLHTHTDLPLTYNDLGYLDNIQATHMA